MMTKKLAPKNALPTGILTSDLKSPPWDSKDKLPYPPYGTPDTRSFEIWFSVGFGWVIPTLGIGKGRNGYAARTYAVATGVGATDRRAPSKGAVVRVGRGPHVLEQHTVYLRKSTAKRLQPFVELMTSGQGKAGMIRDRIGSRRAQGQLERAAGNSSWRWDV